MKLTTKIYLFVFIISLTIASANFYLAERTESALEKQIGHELHDLVNEAMGALDRMLFLRMEEIELQPLDMQLDHVFDHSNLDLEAIPNRKQYIQKVDQAWKQGATPVEIELILSNTLSKEFENKIQFLNQKFHFYVFNEIFATNRYGTIMGCFPRTTDYYQGDEDWYRNAVQSDGISVEDVEYDDSAAAYTVRVSKKVLDEQGNLNGMVTAAINIKIIKDILDEIRQGSNFRTLEYYLVNKQGEVLLTGFNPNRKETSLKPLEFKETFPLWPAITESMKQDREFHNELLQSRPSLVTYDKSKGYKGYKGLGWTLVYVVDRHEVMGPVTQLKSDLITILFPIIAGVLVLIGFFVQSIIKPIQRLTRQADSISHGNWDLKLAVRSKNELGQLAQAFNRMTTVIKTNQDELEAKVEERTRKFMGAQKIAEEAREMDNAKSQFLVNISHEIRTPLNAILGYSQILQRSNNLTDEQKEKLSIVYRSGGHLLALINDILDVSKIEARKENLANHEFNLITLVHQLAEITRVDCQEKELKFKLVSFPLDQEIWVWGDEGKLRRVLVKLLSNAAKFTETGGVLLRVIARKNDTYRFEVVDTGPGIPSDEYASIFEPFRQGKVGKSKGGTGMGLTICQRLVKIMDSELKLESKPGKGSRFYFSLFLPPASKKADPDPALGEFAQKTGAPLIQALLVDDNKANLDILKELISTLGVDVQTAEDGEHSLTLIENWKPDIIFLDHQMPGLTGIEVMQQIHETYGKDRFKIVMTTASTLTHQTKEFLNAGADAVLRKPVVYEDLLKTTHKLLKDKFTTPPSSTNTPAPQTETQAASEPLNYETIEIPQSLWSTIDHNVRMGLFMDFEKNLETLKGLGPDQARLAERMFKLGRRFESKKILYILANIRKSDDN
ncbi:hybrid sensor histidine kinase/response regulator [Nitrospina watsonii]|uniref:histidine kinase n=1 Tax=Nitrospina watsonii TaxID=1323948 RepID=A0ABN8VZ64_9BACT|nr:hybrid sensor histidine kinase/response regulator [Nitrospina watsonii]CAI2718628.1 Histidine kinase [Nitrospina watsonii]